MFTEIMMMGGLFWSATYILIIKRGFKDKTFGMPMATLCANISWEVIFTFITPHDPPQLYVNYIGFALDAIIVMQFLFVSIFVFDIIYLIGIYRKCKNENISLKRF